MSTTNVSRKRTIKVIAFAVFLLAIAVFLYKNIPRRPSPQEDYTVYSEFKKTVTKNKDMLLPSDGVLPLAEYDYTVYYMSRFSNEVEGYALFLKDDDHKKAAVYYVSCRHNTYNENYRSRADLLVNDKEVRIDEYILVSHYATHYSFSSGDYRYYVSCRGNNDNVVKEGLKIITDLARD